MTLLDKLEKDGFDAEALDELVTDTATAQAQRVNNQGLDIQLRYLARHGVSEAEICNHLDIEQE